jgi:succinoglycan biosynthesis transport protein ExoP
MMARTSSTLTLAALRASESLVLGYGARLKRYRATFLIVLALTAVLILTHGSNRVQPHEPRDPGTAATRARLIDVMQSLPQSDSHDGAGRWLVVLLVGCATALTFVGLLDLLNPLMRTPQDAADRLNVTLLGALPPVPRSRTPLISAAEVPHDFAESFRTLRTALLARYPATQTKVLVVTSSHPHDGKTIVATNLAQAFAFGGARVLLIDADLGRPGLHQPLRLTNERGLAQVLNGQARMRDVVQKTPDPNLLAITAGHGSTSAIELLSSERLSELLSAVGHGAFDWVLIDAPSLLESTDAAVLASSAAGVVYVVDATTTRRRDAERGLRSLDHLPSSSIAVVLNKASGVSGSDRYADYRYGRLDHTAPV